MFSSKKVNKPTKKIVKVEEVEVVQKRNRRDRVKLVMEPVKQPKPAIQKTFLKSKNYSTCRRLDLSKIRCWFAMCRHVLRIAFARSDFVLEITFACSDF